MAKQNFLAGGYYGKLGQTVGQRWKNLRTIRAYVVPANPRTAKQQANRGQFGDCVFYAQLGNTLNFKTTAFDTSSITLWNARMKAARGLQDLGLEELNRIPLYPVSFSVPYTISAASITKVTDATSIEITVEGALAPAQRVLTAILLKSGQTSWKERLTVGVGQNTAENPNVFQFSFPEGIDDFSNLQVRFVSCDDEDSAADLIASAQIDLPKEDIDEHTFDTAVSNITRSGNSFSFLLGEDYFAGTTEIGAVTVRAVVAGEWQNITLSNCSLVNQSGKFALYGEFPAATGENIPALPSGATLSIASIVSSSASVYAHAEDVLENIQSNDLTRQILGAYTEIENDESIDFAFPTIKNPATPIGNGTNATLHALKNFKWTDSTQKIYVEITDDELRVVVDNPDNEYMTATGSYIQTTGAIGVIANGVSYHVVNNGRYSIKNNLCNSQISGFSTTTDGYMSLSFNFDPDEIDVTVTGIERQYIPSQIKIESLYQEGTEINISVQSINFEIDNQDGFISFLFTPNLLNPPYNYEEDSLRIIGDYDFYLNLTIGGLQYPVYLSVADNTLFEY